MKPSSPPTPEPQDGAPDPLTLRSWGSVLPPSFEDGPENIIAGRSDLKDRCIFLRSEGQETGLQTGQRGRGRVLRLCGCLGCPPRLPEAPLQRAGWRPCGGVGVVRPSLWTGCPCIPSRTPPCLCQSLVGVFLSLGAMDPPAGWQGTAEGGRCAQAAIWALRDLTCLSVFLSAGGQPLWLGQSLQRLLHQRPPATALQPCVCPRAPQDQPQLPQNRVPVLLPGVPAALPTPHELQRDLPLLVQRLLPQLQPVHLARGHPLLLSLQKK